jgi:hypothetical protein|tara:strand:+ start:191 stop:700 length:510 start_codon:yes stop_codon:yes gene_type:complete
MYANDAASGKNVTGHVFLPLPIETGFKLTFTCITDVALADWDLFNAQLYRFDGTNVNFVAFELYSAFGVTNTIRQINSSGSWETISGYTVPAIATVWTDVELIGNFNATGVDPTYSYLRINDTELTTFADDGQSSASASRPTLQLLFTWQVDDGATRYMFIDRVKLEVF